MKKLVLGGLLILILGVVMVSGCTSSPKVDDTPKINVTNLKVVSQGYGMYDVKATITPNQDISYMEMVVIAYDVDDAVIERSPMAWNTNDAKSGQVQKATGMVFIQGNEKPVKMDVLIFDSVFAGGSESGNIYKQTIKV
jgi:hypothetical protein